MIFGLFELMVIAAVGWVVVNVVRRSTHTERLNPGAHPGSSVTSGERSQTVEVGRGGEEQSRPAQAQQLSPGAQREQKMAELRRRFVADEISVEEYESELDKLIRNQ